MIQENILLQEISSKDTCFHCETLHFGSYANRMVFATLVAGATLVSIDKVENDNDITIPQLLHVIESSRTTIVYSTPFYLKQLCNHLSYSEEAKQNQKVLLDKLSTVDLFVCVADVLLPSTFDHFTQLFGKNKKLQNALGASEYGFLMYNPKGASIKGSIGIPSPFVTIQLMDEQCNPVPRYTAGIIAFKGPKGFNYVGHAKQIMNECYKDGWNITRDIAVEDKETGYYFMQGRREDLIILAGENLSVIDTEEILFKQIRHLALNWLCVV